MYVYIPNGEYGDINDKYPNSFKRENDDFGLSMPKDTPVDLTEFLGAGEPLCPEITISEDVIQRMIYRYIEERDALWMQVLTREITKAIYSNGFSYVETAETLCNLINYFINHPDFEFLTKEDFDLISEQLYLVCVHIIKNEHSLKCREFYTASQTILRWSLKFATKFSYELFRTKHGFNIVSFIFFTDKSAGGDFYHNYAAYSKSGPFFETGILENLAYFVLECGGIPKWLKFLSDHEGEKSPFYASVLKQLIKFISMYEWVLKDNLEDPSYADVMGAIYEKLGMLLRSDASRNVAAFCDYLFMGLRTVDITDDRVKTFLNICKELLKEDKLYPKMNSVVLLDKFLSLIKPGDVESKKQLNEWFCANDVYQILFFVEQNDSLLSNSEKLFQFMLEGNSIDGPKLVSLVVNSTNPEMTRMVSSAFETGAFHPQTISLIVDALIDKLSKDSEDDALKNALVTALKYSKSDAVLKKKFVNLAINETLKNKADPQKTKALFKNFERVLSIEGYCDQEDLIKFVSITDHEKDPAVRTLGIVGIRTLFNVLQSVDDEKRQRILAQLVDEFTQFCREDTPNNNNNGGDDDGYSLGQRLSAFTAILAKAPAHYDVFKPAVEAILASPSLALKEQGSSWMTGTLKAGRLCGVDYGHLASALFANASDATALITSNPACFGLFEVCFLHFNGMSEASGFRIKALPISHLDDLVRIVLSPAAAGAVFEKAAGLLVRALDAVSLESLDEMAAFRRGFVADALLAHLGEAPERRPGVLRLLGALLSDATRPLSCMDMLLGKLAARFPALKPDSPVFVAALNACPDSVEAAAEVVKDMVADETFDEDDYPADGVVGVPGQSFSELLASDPELSEKVFGVLFAPEVVAAASSVEDFYARSGIGALPDVAAAAKCFVLPTFSEELAGGRLFCGADDAIRNFLAAEVVVRAGLAAPMDVYERMKECAFRAIKPLDEKGPSSAALLLVSAVASIVSAAGEPLPGLGKLFINLLVTLLLKGVVKGVAPREYVRGMASSLSRMVEKIPADEAATIDLATKVYTLALSAEPETVALLVSLAGLLCRRSAAMYKGLVSKLGEYVLCGNTAEVRGTKERILLGSVFPAFFALYDSTRAAENGATFSGEFLAGCLSAESSPDGVLAYFDNEAYARSCVRFLSLIGAGASLGPEYVGRLVALIGHPDDERTRDAMGLLGAIVERSAPGSAAVERCVEAWNRAFEEGDLPRKGKVRRGKHGGLENVQSNCYANAAIQMLYMSEFRSVLLGLPLVEKAPEEFRSAKEFRLCKKTVAEAQRLFVEMLVSNKEASDPSKMIQSFWGNLGQQDDIYGFMVAFIDKVRTYEMAVRSLSDSCSSLSLSSVGESIYSQKETEVLCCAGHSSRTKSLMNVISLCIEDADTLDEAIAATMRGERIHNYKCLECGEGAAVEASLTSRITSLGDTLIFRFDRVNYDTVSNRSVKNHKKVRFGLEIDMAKHVKGATEPDVFVLSGIVMHVGDANSGHYYAYLRDSSTAPGEKDRWYKFNDRSVLPWDVENLAEDCCSCITAGDPDTSKSPYILLYTRKDVPPNVPREEFIKDVLGGDDEENEEEKKDDDDCDNDSDSGSIRALVKEILAENARRDKLNILLNPDFNRLAIKFCAKYFEGRGGEEAESMAQLILSRTVSLALEGLGFQLDPWMAELYPKLARFYEFDDSFINLCESFMDLATTSNLALYLGTAAKVITAYAGMRGIGGKSGLLESFFAEFFRRYFDGSTTIPPPAAVRFVLDLLKAKNRALDTILVKSSGLHYLLKTFLKYFNVPALLPNLILAISELLTRFQLGGEWGTNKESPLAGFPSIWDLCPQTAKDFCINGAYDVLVMCSVHNPEAVAAILRHVVYEVDPGMRGSITRVFLKYMDYLYRGLIPVNIHSLRVLLKGLSTIGSADVHGLVMSDYLTLFRSTAHIVFNLNKTTISEAVREELIGIYEDMVEFAKGIYFQFQNDSATTNSMNITFEAISGIIEANPNGPLNDRLSAAFNMILEMVSEALN